MLTTTENKFRKHDLIFVNILTIKHKNLRVDCRGNSLNLNSFKLVPNCRSNSAATLRATSEFHINTAFKMQVVSRPIPMRLTWYSKS